MAALAICAVTAALLRCHAGTQAPPPATPGQPPPAGPGMIPLTVPEIRRLLAALPLRPRLPGHAAHWLHCRPATRLAPAGTTSERASLAMPRSPRSVSNWLLSY
jgi:hypothetical protein